MGYAKGAAVMQQAPFAYVDSLCRIRFIACVRVAFSSAFILWGIPWLL